MSPFLTTTELDDLLQGDPMWDPLEATLAAATDPWFSCEDSDDEWAGLELTPEELFDADLDISLDVI